MSGRSCFVIVLALCACSSAPRAPARPADPRVVETTEGTITGAIDADGVRSFLGVPFAATGDPNGAGAPAWPRYDIARDQHIVLDVSPSAGAKLRDAECAHWDRIDP